jgi:hypothetical protein
MEIHHSQKFGKLRKLWKVINFTGKTLFVGRYGESYRYILQNRLTRAVLQPMEMVGQ